MLSRLRNKLWRPKKPPLVLADNVELARRFAMFGGMGAAGYLLGVRQAMAQQSTPTFEGVLSKGFYNLASQPTTTARDLQHWRGDIFNVKDFGAKGDGSTDDTTAIQNAINAALVKGGIVFFPYGNYLISSKLVCTNSGAGAYSGIQLIGSGSSTSGNYGATITATAVADYMIDGTNGDGGGGALNPISRYQGINFNQQTANGNCVLTCGFNTVFSNCYFNLPGSGSDSFGVAFGHTGVSTGVIGCVIEACTFNGGGQVGHAIHPLAGANGMVIVIGCRFSGLNVACDLSGTGSCLMGGSIETSNTGVIVGAGSLVTGVQIEDCYTAAINCIGPAGAAVIGNWISGPDANPKTTGILLGDCIGVLISGNLVSGSAIVTGIDCSNVTGNNVVVQGNAVNCATNYAVPTDYTGGKSDITFSGNGYPFPYLGVGFAHLPGYQDSGAGQSLAEGVEYECSDCPTAPSGNFWAIITLGSGSNHAKLRCSATASFTGVIDNGSGSAGHILNVNSALVGTILPSMLISDAGAHITRTTPYVVQAYGTGGTSGTGSTGTYSLLNQDGTTPSVHITSETMYGTQWRIA